MELFLSLISLLSLGTSYFLAGRISKSTTPLRSLFLFQCIGIPFFILFLPFGEVQVTSIQVVKILAIGVFQTFVMLLFFYAMKIGIVSIVSALNDLFMLVTALLGIILLGESWSIWKIIALFCIACGGVALSIQIKELKGKKTYVLMRGALPAFLAAIGTGFYLFFETNLVRESGWLVVSSGIRVSITLTGFVILIVQRERIYEVFQGVSWRWVVPAAFLDVIGFSLYNIAITSGEISYVTAIVSAQSLVIAALSYVFLKERLLSYQLFGIFVIVAGLVGLQFV